MYINNIYREGKWATKIEIEGRRSLLKYFVESAKVFKEMSAEKLKARMKSKWSKGVKGVKDCIKREVGKIENCYITKINVALPFLNLLRSHTWCLYILQTLSQIL